MIIGQEVLNTLFKLKDGQALFNELIELEETGKYEHIGIGKTWDALHFLLTGITAGEPIYDNKLSEAIVGVHNFHFFKADDPFITGTENSELGEIIDAMEAIDFKEILNSFDYEEKTQAKNDIYPKGIWGNPREALKEELNKDFENILKLYKKAKEKGHHIIVSIF